MSLIDERPSTKKGTAPSNNDTFEEYEFDAPVGWFFKCDAPVRWFLDPSSLNLI